MKETHFNFITPAKLFIPLSMLLVFGSLWLIFFGKGLNFGIDFKGGTKLQYRFTQEISDTEIRDRLGDLGLGDLSVQRIGTQKEHRFLIKVKQGPDVESLSAKITTALSVPGAPPPTLEEEATVGPKAGAELRKKAVLALLISWALMLIYVGYRFDFYFAPGAILALLHDVIVTAGAFVLTGREFTLTAIAALLTIIGYSINDTIVIYDRVRENIPKMPKHPLIEIINVSMNQTLSRTIITSLTVLMVVLVLFLLGTGEIEGFGFAMTVGVVAGTYSTIYIASPAYLLLKKISERRKHS